jgi:kynurenine/2-aminoadipate aminotransferase
MTMDRVEWSDQGKRLTYGTLKQVICGASGPDTVPLHGGLPPDEGLPIQSMTLKLYNNETVEIPMTMGQQQYNVPAIGFEPLRSWCEAHTKRQHGVPQDRMDTTTMITDSTTHALDAVTSVLMNPGDSILIEEYTYCHFIDCTVERQGYQPLSVPMDEGGITPEGLEKVILDRIEMSKRVVSSSHCFTGAGSNGITSSTSTMNGTGGGRRSLSAHKLIPRVLYVIPTAQNPTGCSYSYSRRRAIYAVCQRYDIIIIEDDPYYYLQFDVDKHNENAQPGIRDLASHSFLSLDVDGRVVRLDSFAKFLAPGFRLGWATGPRDIIDKMAMKIHSATLGGNMMCQSIVFSMLHHWGDSGLAAYVSRMQGLYAKKAASALNSLEKHMKDIAVWRKPVGGMFVWIRLLHVDDAREFFDSLKESGVVVMPGHVSLAEKTDVDGNSKCCPHIRISFSYISAEAISEGIRRIAEEFRSRYACTPK